MARMPIVAAVLLCSWRRGSWLTAVLPSLLSAVVFAAPAHAAESTTHQGDAAHTGRVIDDALAGPLEERWSRGLPVEATSYPVIVDGRVFVSGTMRDYRRTPALFALERDGGAVLWRRHLDGEPGYADGRVFVVSPQGVLTAMAAQDGRTLWERNLKAVDGQWAFDGAPVAHGGRVFVGGDGLGSSLYALDAQDGRLVWRKPVPSAALLAAASGDSVFTYGTCLLTSSLAAADGVRQWLHATGCSGGLSMDSLAVYGGLVWVRDTGLEGALAPGAALDARTGRLVRSLPASWAPAFHGESVLFVRDDGILEAQDIRSGATLWTATPSAPLRTAPFVVNDTVYAGTATGTLHGFDVSSGREAWRRELSMPLADGKQYPWTRIVHGFGAGEGVLVTPGFGGASAWSPGPIRIIGGSRNITRAPSMSFTLENSDGAPMQCRLDGGGGSGIFTPCTNPIVVDGLTDGEYALHVRSGHGGPTVVRRWTVDRTAPRIFIDSDSAGAVVGGDTWFGISTDEDAALSCRTDDGPWRACAPVEEPAEHLNLPGSHVFEVRATDRAGNNATERRAWTFVPGDAVYIGFLTALPPVTRSSSLEIKPYLFNEPAGTTIECRVDAAPFQPCPDSTITTLTALGEGRHRLEARAVLPNGSRTQPVARIWMIDQTGPAVRLDEGPPEGARSAGRRFAYSASEPATFLCSLDDAEWNDCNVTVSYPDLDPGPHTFRVLARDQLSNDGPVLVRRWIHDPAAYDPDPQVRPLPRPLPPPSAPAATDAGIADGPFTSAPAPMKRTIEPTKPRHRRAIVRRLTPRLRILRATIQGRRLEVLARITPGVAGRLSVTLRHSGIRTTFNIDRAVNTNGRIRIVRRLPRVRVKLHTATLTLRYAGTARVRPVSVTVRVARRT